MRALLVLVNLEPVVQPETRAILAEVLGRGSEYLGILRFWLAHLSEQDRMTYEAARAKLPEIDTWVTALS